MARMRNRLLMMIPAVLLLAGCDRTPALEVSGHARPTVAGQNGSAAYLVITNKGGGEDRLLAVSSPAVGTISIHETLVEGGIARMRSTEPPAIAAGETLTMAPGGMHLMLMDLKAPLAAGERLPLMLRFERSGVLQTAIPIQMEAPDGHSPER